VDSETMLDMFFNACLIDWNASAREWRRLVGILEKGDQIRITGKNTDLSFSIKGRKWVVGDGRINMPDGEIFTAPDETTLNGRIYYEFPGVFGGRLVPDIQLTWKNGKLVEADASDNLDYLKQVLTTDPGASLIGEFAIGVNSAINLYTTDILIDEKIGGTLHTGIGRPYKECGGTYTSAIHWDIVKDTRQEGAIYMDNKLVFENGKFLI
jgi:aminopeptidase